MHAPSLAALAVVASIGLARAALAGPPDVAAEARQALGRNDGVAAVALLERGLADAGPARAVMIDLLRRAYPMAADQARAAGRPAEAETYRDNLKILNRKAKPAPAPPAVATPTPASVEPQPEPAPNPMPLPESPDPGPASEPASPPVEIARAPEPAPTPEVPIEDLAAGDAAFSSKNYPEAGRIYANLARDGKLPAGRKEHWAYCRSASVVERINARPRSEAEWAAIDAEIDQIRAMNPDNWLGEYLRNRASERLVARRKPQPGKMVVRASSPEEPPAAERPVRPASLPSAAEPPPGVKPPADPARAGTSAARWQTRDTPNFRIYHANPALAEKVAQAAESARAQQAKRWNNSLGRSGWQPRCEVYLYPSAKQYAQATHQPEDSPGISTMEMNGGRISARKIELRADHPTLIPAVLPHEITHVILADVFPTQQIPRWADEGLAVLSEPLDEQDRRAADLVDPLAANQLFPVRALMSMDYPHNRYWALYYAQSVSLTRFLVEQGTPAQMVQFLQGSQRNGYEAELRRIYRIDGFADLQTRWLAHARNTTPGRGVTAAKEPDLKVR